MKISASGLIWRMLCSSCLQRLPVRPLHLGNQDAARRGNLIPIDVRKFLTVAVEGIAVQNGDRRQQGDSLVLNQADVVHHVAEHPHTGRLHNQIFRVDGVGDGQNGGSKVRLHRAADAPFGQLPDVQLARILFPTLRHFLFGQQLPVNADLPVLIFHNGKIFARAAGKFLDKGCYALSQSAGNDQNSHRLSSFSRRF